MTWFVRPRTSASAARSGGLVADASRNPFWIPRAGRLERAVVTASASTAARARSSVASKSAGSVRPRPRPRALLRAGDRVMSTGATIELGVGWTSRARLRAAAGADRAASGRAARRVAAARLRARDRRGAPPHLRRAAGRAAGESSSSSTTRRSCPARIPIESPRGEVLLLERLEDGTWEALARPTRRLRPGGGYGPVELLEHLGEGRWRVRLDGEPAGETPLPPYITEPLGDPARYQTVYAREPGSAAAPTAGSTSRRSCSRGSTSSASRSTSASTRSGRSPRRRSRSTDPRRALRGRAGGVGADPGRGARPRRRHDDGARARDARPRRAARRPHRAVHHAGLRVPPRRRAPDELPPAALDAARARDGVRGSGGDARLYRLAVDERYRFYSFGDAMLIL